MAALAAAGTAAARSLQKTVYSALYLESTPVAAAAATFWQSVLSTPCLLAAIAGLFLIPASQPCLAALYAAESVDVPDVLADAVEEVLGVLVDVVVAVLAGVLVLVLAGVLAGVLVDELGVVLLLAAFFLPPWLELPHAATPKLSMAVASTARYLCITSPCVVFAWP